jgi:hypothetical protein
MNKTKTAQFYNRSNCIDSINELINEYNPNSYEKKSTTRYKSTITQTTGNLNETISNTTNKNRTSNIKMQNKTTEFIELINNITIQKEDKENINWLENLLITNGINIPQLFPEFMLI